MQTLSHSYQLFIIQSVSYDVTLPNITLTFDLPYVADLVDETLH